MSIYKAIMSHLFSTFVDGMNQNAEELESHLAESATWIRVDNLSAPIEITGATMENGTIIPLSEYAQDGVYAIKFKTIGASDSRSSQFAIIAGNRGSSAGTILAAANGSSIFTCYRTWFQDNLVLYNAQDTGGTTQPLSVMGIYKIKD